MPTEEEALARLISGTMKASNWLVGYCCSRKGLDFGHELKRLLEDYEGARDGHSTSDRSGTSTSD